MHTRIAGLYFLVALLLGTIVLSYFIFEPFLAPLFLAAVFASVLQPLYHRILSKLPLWPSLSALLTVLITVVCILVPLVFVGAQIGSEARDLYTGFRGGDARALVQNAAFGLESAVVSYVPAARGFSENLSENLSSYAETALQWVIQHVGSAATGVAGVFLKFFLFFIALYYLLRDGAKLKAKLVELSPLRDMYDEQIFDRLELAVNSVIKGNLTIALLQGILTGIGFAIFGVPNSFLWGTVAALAALIPGLGTGLIFVPTVLFMFFTGNEPAALGLAIWGLLAVGLIDNFLGPQLIGRGVNLHPLLVLLSVLGGLALFGPVGLFLGPLTLSLLFAFLSIYTEIAKRSQKTGI